MSDRIQFVWVFNGTRANFPSAIFERKEEADLWIEKNRLTGVLTHYPVNVSAYDWAIEEGVCKATDAKHKDPDFIAKFSSASMRHFHYENGIQDSF